MDFFICSTIILAIWGALGPLVGVRYGQELSSRFQRSQWIAENRKQECRELLGAMTAHAAAIGIAHDSRATPAERQRRDALEIALISLFDDRLFISEDILKLNLRRRWFAGPGSSS